MKHRIIATALSAIAICGLAQAGPVEPTGTSHAEISASQPWSAEEEDNICGITNLRRVSRPAVVDYEALLEATPQMKEIEEEGVDPDSVEGRTLRKAARTLIIKSCEKVREGEGYCSVWKAISHSDGRTIADITEAVIERF